MTENKLPGLLLELPELATPEHGHDETRPLAELLDEQRALLGKPDMQGWRRLSFDTPNLELSLQSAALLRENATELLVIGMGGSVNGARAVHSALELSGSVHSALEFLDNPDPLSIISTLEVIDPERCAVMAVSRSGSTLETVAMLAAVLQHVPAGPLEDKGPACAVCSLPNDNPLARLAGERGWLQLPIPEDVGGRFSVFSPAGLVPLAFCGIDISRLLESAAETATLLENLPLADNPAWQLSGMLTAAGSGNAVLYHYADCLSGLAEWWRQLLAESTGRRMADGSSVGITPLVARGAADQHSQNQLYLDGPGDPFFVFIDIQEPSAYLSINRSSEFLPAGFERLRGLEFSHLQSASARGTLQALQEAGRRCARIGLEGASEQALGSLLQLWMYTTACLGLRLGINPYDQPAVERGKRITAGLLDAATGE